MTQSPHREPEVMMAVESKRAADFGTVLDSIWRCASRRSAALRAEPVAPSQAKPAATIAVEGRGTQRDRRRIRKALRDRDGDLCCWCHEPMRFPEGPGEQWLPDFASIEHIIPRSLGGSDGLDNLALSHLRCNQARNPNQDEAARDRFQAAIKGE